MIEVSKSTSAAQSGTAQKEETTKTNAASLRNATPKVEPSLSTVVIGKGKVPRGAPGNRRLRSLVQNRLKEYVGAKTKLVKSSIVTSIYFSIEQFSSQEGGPPFVRYDGQSYNVVSESVAREKITSTFRDSLHDRYKSSSKNKVAKRRLANKRKAERERNICRIPLLHTKASFGKKLDHELDSLPRTGHSFTNYQIQSRHQMTFPSQSTQGGLVAQLRPEGHGAISTVMRIQNGASLYNLQSVPTDPNQIFMHMNTSNDCHDQQSNRAELDAFPDNIHSPLDSFLFEPPLPDMKATVEISAPQTSGGSFQV